MLLFQGKAPVVPSSELKKTSLEVKVFKVVSATRGGEILALKAKGGCSSLGFCGSSCPVCRRCLYCLANCTLHFLKFPCCLVWTCFVFVGGCLCVIFLCAKSKEITGKLAVNGFSSVGRFFLRGDSLVVLVQLSFRNKGRRPCSSLRIPFHQRELTKWLRVIANCLISPQKCILTSGVSWSKLWCPGFCSVSVSGKRRSASCRSWTFPCVLRWTHYHIVTAGVAFTADCTGL